MIREYYWLTKPGIIYGNLITAAAGFFLASKGGFDSWLFFSALAGLAFIIASACVFNNIIDHDIDERMERTKNRAMASKSISRSSAILFSVLLGIIGVLILHFYTNPLTLSVALAGLFVYVAVYTPVKRYSVFGTLIGAIPGATPPVVGYLAATNQIDAAAVILFLILICWQMPHFYAIAIYRLDDYTRARIPVLPVKKGIWITKINILAYIILFTVAAAMLTIFGYTGIFYLTIAGLLGLTWIWFAIRGFKTDNNKLWAQKMFRFSLVVLLLVSVMISIDVI